MNQNQVRAPDSLRVSGPLVEPPSKATNLPNIVQLKKNLSSVSKLAAQNVKTEEKKKKRSTERRLTSFKNVKNLIFR